MRRFLAPGRALAAAGAALLVAGCGGNNSSEFPVSDGFKPLDDQSSQVWPDAAGNVPALTDGPAPGSGYSESWGHALVPGPLSKVWAALQDPLTSHIHPPSGGTVTPIPGVEGNLFPLSFRIDYTSPTGVPLTPDVEWEITYRGGALQGTVDDLDSTTASPPPEIGLRFQKTWGTTNIMIESGSLVASLVPGSNPPVTRIEYINQLSTRLSKKDQTNVLGTTNDLYGNLIAKLATMP